VRHKSVNKLFLAIFIFAFTLRFLWLYAPVVRDEADGGYIGMLWLRGYSVYSYSRASRPPLLYLMYLIPNLIFARAMKGELLFEPGYLNIVRKKNRVVSAQ